MGQMSDLQIEFDDFCYLMTIEWGVEDYHKWIFGDSKDYEDSTNFFNGLQSCIINNDFTWIQFIELKKIKEDSNLQFNLKSLLFYDNGYNVGPFTWKDFVQYINLKEISEKCKRESIIKEKKSKEQICDLEDFEKSLINGDWEKKLWRDEQELINHHLKIKKITQKQYNNYKNIINNEMIKIKKITT